MADRLLDGLGQLREFRADLAAEQVRSAPPGIMHVVLRALTQQPTLAVLTMLGIGALTTGGAS